MLTLLLGLLALVQTTPVFLGQNTGAVAAAAVLFAWDEATPADYFVLCLDDQPFETCPHFTPTDPTGTSFVGPLANVPPGTHTLSVYACVLDTAIGCSDPGTLTFPTSAPATLANLRTVGGS